jgi:hypothetical protein
MLGPKKGAACDECDPYPWMWLEKEVICRLEFRGLFLGEANQLIGKGLFDGRLWKAWGVPLGQALLQQPVFEPSACKRIIATLLIWGIESD